VVIKPRWKHKHSLIWLPGIGSKGEMYKTIFTTKDMIKMPATAKVIVPTAPVREIVLLKDKEYVKELAPSWFDMDIRDFH
jgi:hypothetical protein